MTWGFPKGRNDNTYTMTSRKEKDIDRKIEEAVERKHEFISRGRTQIGPTDYKYWAKMRMAKKEA